MTLIAAADSLILALLCKGDAAKVSVDVKCVGYGPDYAEKYRNLRGVGVLAKHVYA